MNAEALSHLLISHDGAYRANTSSRLCIMLIAVSLQGILDDIIYPVYRSTHAKKLNFAGLPTCPTSMAMACLALRIFK